MASTELILSIEWSKEEADGETCLICGDQCFAEVRKLYATINGRRFDKPSAFFCRSCYELTETI